MAMDFINHPYYKAEMVSRSGKATKSHFLCFADEIKNSLLKNLHSHSKKISNSNFKNFKNFTNFKNYNHMNSFENKKNSNKQSREIDTKTSKSPSFFFNFVDRNNTIYQKFTKKASNAASSSLQYKPKYAIVEKSNLYFNSFLKIHNTKRKKSRPLKSNGNNRNYRLTNNPWINLKSGISFDKQISRKKKPISRHGGIQYSNLSYDIPITNNSILVFDFNKYIPRKNIQVTRCMADYCVEKAPLFKYNFVPSTTFSKSRKTPLFKEPKLNLDYDFNEIEKGYKLLSTFKRCQTPNIDQMPSRDHKFDTKHKKNKSTYLISYYKPYLTSVGRTTFDEKDTNAII